MIQTCLIRNTVYEIEILYLNFEPIRACLRNSDCGEMHRQTDELQSKKFLIEWKQV